MFAQVRPCLTEVAYEGVGTGSPHEITADWTPSPGWPSLLHRDARACALAKGLPPKMGSVEELPSGRWRGVPWNAAAKRRGPSATFDSWTAADAYWRRIEAEFDGTYVAAGLTVDRQRHRPGFAAHVLAWAAAGIEDGELSTRRGYQSQARQLAARWPSERVDEITELMIRAHLAELRDAGLAPSTRSLRLTVLRHAMRAAIKAGYRSDDPTLGVKGPRKRDAQPRILTDPELMLVLAFMPGWLWPAVLLSHDAGLRVDEVAGLRVGSLNLLHGTVTVAHIVEIDGTLRPYPKSKEIFDVPLSARLLTALRGHIQDYPPAGATAAVFRNPDWRARGELKPEAIRGHFNRAVKRAGLDEPRPTWHDLRHSCGTILAESGASPWVIKEILRHGSIATTQRYVRKANLARQSAAIGLAFGRAETLEQPGRSHIQVTKDAVNIRLEPFT